MQHTHTSLHKKKGIIISSVFNHQLSVEKQITVANALSMFSLYQEAAHNYNIHLIIRFFKFTNIILMFAPKTQRQHTTN